MQENPEHAPLFGGLAGATLGVDEFEVCEGLFIRRTYAHLMSPFVLAFRRPEPLANTNLGHGKQRAAGYGWMSRLRLHWTEKRVRQDSTA